MFYGFPDDQVERVLQLILQVKTAYRDIGYHTYTGDMLCTFGRNQSFVYDPRFRDAFDHNAADANEETWLWRLHTLTWAATQAARLPGDFVECGTFRGFMSAVVCEYLDFAKLEKTFYLYDSFAGLPERWSTEGERRHTNPVYANAEGYSLAAVQQRFAGYSNVRVIQGVVPEIFRSVSPDRIAYLHVDLNSAAAEIAALEALFDRVVPGGTIIFDDFGHMTYAEQHTAETTWMRERGYAILELPTGQGLVVKQ
jgi:O-methyltransferase